MNRYQVESRGDKNRYAWRFYGAIADGERDAKWIAGDFCDPAWEIPPEKRWLLHYFVTDLHRAFLRYTLIFGYTYYFREHTGEACTYRMMERLARRYKALTQMHFRAKKAMDLERLAEIELGKIPRMDYR